MGRTEGSTNLTPELKRFIYCRALQSPKIPRETLATALKYEIEAEERDDWRVPSHDNLIRMISEARNHTPNPLDGPWSIGCLAEAEYDIPPETLPIVLQVWVYALEHKWKPLTIRQVKWVARLSYVVKDLASLYTAALDLAQDERITEITGVYLMHTATHETLYTIMTGKHVNLDTETLRSIALKESEEWLEAKERLKETKGGKP